MVSVRPFLLFLEPVHNANQDSDNRHGEGDIKYELYHANLLTTSIPPGSRTIKHGA